MSLMRIALRLASVECLNADPILAVLCKGRIYDSRIAPISAFETAPMIVIAAEDDQGDERSINNGGPPFKITTGLVVELTFGSVQYDEQGELILGVSCTDREIETTIDVMESRVINQLGAGIGAWPELLREFITLRIKSLKSSRYSADDMGERLAQRHLMLDIELKDEDGAMDALQAIARLAIAGSSTQQSIINLAGLFALANPPDTPFTGINMDFVPREGAVTPVQPQPNDDRQFFINANPP